MKINTVPYIQGQAEITYRGPSEKQTSGQTRQSQLAFGFWRLAWGGWCYDSVGLWGFSVSSKTYFLFIVARLGNTYDWSQSNAVWATERAIFLLLSPKSDMATFKKKKKALKLLRNGRCRYGNIKLLPSPIIKIILNIMLVILLIKEKNRRLFRGRYTC